MAHLPLFESIGENNHETLLEPKAQYFVKNAFWPNSKASIVEYESYFRYFRWTISILTWPDDIPIEEYFAIQTYGDLARFVEYMRLNQDEDRLKIAEIIQEDFKHSRLGQILRSMDLAARLWLTIHMRSKDFPVGPHLSDITETPWRDESSLKKVIQGCFPPFLTLRNDIRIERDFTAQSLQKLCRVRTRWTANLKDHLSYDSATATLHVYPHKVLLISQLESCDILPEAFVLETIRTLDLLFPFGEAGTQKYLDRGGQFFYRASSRDQPRPTNLSEFHYWHSRLAELHDVFHQAPKSIPQIWHDRRNPVQWWTFWLAVIIAVLTIMFGILASYTGFKQVMLAEQSYRMSLLQACSQNAVPPEVCVN